MGYIYVAYNENIPKLVKIGFTERQPYRRVEELSTHTGVPRSFTLMQYWQVVNPALAEQLIFSKLQGDRVSKEFFGLTPARAISLINMLFSDFESLAALLDQDSEIQYDKKDVCAHDSADDVLMQKADAEWKSKRLKVREDVVRTVAIKFGFDRYKAALREHDELARRREKSDLALGAAMIASAGLLIPAMAIASGFRKKKAPPAWQSTLIEFSMACKKEYISRKQKFYSDLLTRTVSESEVDDNELFYAVDLP